MNPIPLKKFNNKSEANLFQKRLHIEEITQTRKKYLGGVLSFQGLANIKTAYSIIRIGIKIKFIQQ